MNSIFNFKKSEEAIDVDIAVEIILVQNILSNSEMSPNLRMLSRHESNESSQSSGYFSDYKVPTKKRFQCPHCGLYPSNRRSKIMKHIKKMHSPKYDHKCLHCKKTFHSKVYLKLHIKVTHPEALKIAIDEDVSESNAKVELPQVAMNISCFNDNNIQDNVMA